MEEGGGGLIHGGEWRKEEGFRAAHLSPGRGKAPAAAGHGGGGCRSVRQGRVGGVGRSVAHGRYGPAGVG
jgi:hypothetical protein